MGRHANNNTSNIVKYTAGTDITQNDLVTLNETYTINKAPVDLTNVNNSTAGLSTMKSMTPIVSNIYYANMQSISKTICECGDGDYIAVYSGSGTASAADINVKKISKTGSVIKETKIFTGGTNVFYTVHKLTSNSVVVVWQDNTGTDTTYFAILDNDLNVTKSSTTVGNNQQSGVDYCAVAVLNNSDFVIVRYGENTADSGYIVFTRYNSSGVLQGSQTNVEATTNTQHYSIAPTSDGGFVILYNRHIATYGVKLAKFDSNGTAVTTTVLSLITSTTYVLSGGSKDRAVQEMSNGNLVCITSSPGSNYNPQVVVLDSNLNILKTIVLPTAVKDSEYPALAVNSDGFALCYNLTSEISFNTFDSSGNAIISDKRISNPGIDSTMLAVYMGLLTHYISNFGYVIQTSKSTSTSANDYAVILVDEVGDVIGSTIIIKSSQSQELTQSWGELHSNKTLAIVINDTDSNNNLEVGIFNVGKRSIVGVAIESATANNTVNVATNGTFTLNDTHSNGSNFDTTTGDYLGGAKGAVTGNKANLI